MVNLQRTIGKPSKSKGPLKVADPAEGCKLSWDPPEDDGDEPYSLENQWQKINKHHVDSLGNLHLVMEALQSLAISLRRKTNSAASKQKAVEIIGDVVKQEFQI
ncbi:hypothetical protein AVEN_28897-1 [Araneus ventricosus]|uniref:Uncharacterized protein n=1 Tax=Araneus ventricosus TaxID=182803 RepID=A0A4Y2AJM4_ARAVE|nr:hypothetical protein AVEN_28897-1 [Araneus ventricosus]